MVSLKKFFAALLTVGMFLALCGADNYKIKVSLDKRDGIYKKGDKITLIIAYYLNNRPATGPVNVEMNYSDGTKKVTFFPEAPKTFVYTADKSPYAVQFTVTALTPDKKPLKISRGKRSFYVTASIGAIIDPQDFRTGFTEPKDFQKFWDDTKAELAKIPVKELERKEMKLDDKMLRTAPNYFAFRIVAKMPSPKALVGKFKSYDVKVACLGAPVSGYLTMPANAAPKSLPAIVSFHGAPGGSARQAFADGVIRFDVNPHGFENGHPRSYYKAKYQTAAYKAYQFKNSGDRNKYYFRGMFIRVMRALEYVKSLPEFDGKTLIVVGNSQGGAQALVAAGLDPDVKLVYASVPAMCDHGGALAGRVPGWPKVVRFRKGKPVRPEVAAAAPYFDAAFFAKRIKAEAYLTTGLLDNVCSSSSVFCAYNNIPGKKHITVFPRKKHSATFSLEFNKRLLEVINAAAAKK